VQRRRRFRESRTPANRLASCAAPTPRPQRACARARRAQRLRAVGRRRFASAAGVARSRRRRGRSNVAMHRVMPDERASIAGIHSPRPPCVPGIRSGAVRTRLRRARRRADCPAGASRGAPGGAAAATGASLGAWHSRGRGWLDGRPKDVKQGLPHRRRRRLAPLRSSACGLAASAALRDDCRNYADTCANYIRDASRFVARTRAAFGSRQIAKHRRQQCVARRWLGRCSLGRGPALPAGRSTLVAAEPVR